MTMLDRIRLGIKGAGAAIAALWGGLPSLVQLLIILMVVDIVLGMLVAVQRKELSSNIAWRGMTKKAVILLIVATAAALENYAAPLVGAIPILSAVSGFYCAAELLSILENAALAGVRVPKVLRDVMAKLSSEKNDDG